MNTLCINNIDIHVWCKMCKFNSQVKFEHYKKIYSEN